MGKICFISRALFLVICVVLVLYNNNFGSCQCTTAYWAPTIPGKKLIASPLSLETASDLIECLLKCFTADGCISFNFGSGAANRNICELLKTNRHFLPSNFIAAAGWTYTGKKSECGISTCPLNQSCLSDYDKNTYICINASGTDCQSILNQGRDLSGTYDISVNGLISPVYCDQITDGGGWLVIQRNMRNLTFFKSWQEFKHGFGYLNLSFWWGNEKIHQLTWSREFELRVDLKRANGQQGYAKYTGFKLSNEDDGYRLFLKPESYIGNIGDAMFRNNFDHQSVGKKFTTKDKDQDTFGGNCATDRKSAWWYGYCSYADLNRHEMLWMTWTGPLVQAEIKIRPIYH